MKTMLKAFSAVALSGAMVVPVLAGTEAPTSKDMKKALEDNGINYVETAQKGITLSGYVDTSYTMQFAGSGQPFQQQYGVTGVNSTSKGNTTANLHQFDNNADGFNVNAVKLALEKALPDKNDWAAGFRIDLMAGSDATVLNQTDKTLSAGGGGSLYVEQALIKFRIPIGNGLDIYMGKFVTFLGYEVIESPANLNYSRGLLFTNAIPLTHTGAYADYKFNDTIEAKFGVVDGWNDSSSEVYQPGGGNQYAFGGKAITGQINVNAPGKNANITESFIYSPNSNEDQVGSGATGATVVYDIWGNWNPTFVKDSALLLGFNGDFGYNSNNGVIGATPHANDWYGVALYSQYKFTKVFSLAGRLEWLAEDNAGNQPSAGNFYVPKFSTGLGGTTNDYSATLTANFNIWDNLLTRLEYRHDFLQGIGDAAQDEISVNAVYSF